MRTLRDGHPGLALLGCRGDVEGKKPPTPLGMGSPGVSSFSALARLIWISRHGGYGLNSDSPAWKGCPAAHPPTAQDTNLLTSFLTMSSAHRSHRPYLAASTQCRCGLGWHDKPSEVRSACGSRVRASRHLEGLSDDGVIISRIHHGPRTAWEYTKPASSTSSPPPLLP